VIQGKPRDSLINAAVPRARSRGSDRLWPSQCISMYLNDGSRCHHGRGKVGAASGLLTALTMRSSRSHFIPLNSAGEMTWEAALLGDSPLLRGTGAWTPAAMADPAATSANVAKSCRAAADRAGGANLTRHRPKDRILLQSSSLMGDWPDTRNRACGTLSTSFCPIDRLPV
jgi:hypothetical protein